MLSDRVRIVGFTGLVVLVVIEMLAHLGYLSRPWPYYWGELVAFVELEFYAALVVGALSQLHEMENPVLHAIGVVALVLLYCMALVPWGIAWWFVRRALGLAPITSQAPRHG
jgi:hypothetical protein